MRERTSSAAGVILVIAIFALLTFVADERSLPGCPLGALCKSSSTTTYSGNSGAMGAVSIGPLCPVQQVNSTVSCGISVDYTQYVLTFTLMCPAGQVCPTSSVRLASDGSYSIALMPAGYLVTMTPCSWVGCSTTFPAQVTVNSGQYTTANFTVDTGIR